jgi:hypothetical protein
MSISNAILTGSAILGIGFLVVSVVILEEEWRRETASRLRALRAAGMLSYSVNQMLEIRIEEILVQATIIRSRLRVRSREGARAQVADAQASLNRLRGLLAPADELQDILLDLSVDEIAFLDSRTEAHAETFLKVLLTIESIERAIAEIRTDFLPGEEGL